MAATMAPVQKSKRTTMVKHPMLNTLSSPSHFTFSLASMPDNITAAVLADRHTYAKIGYGSGPDVWPEIFCAARISSPDEEGLVSSLEQMMSSTRTRTSSNGSPSKVSNALWRVTPEFVPRHHHQRIGGDGEDVDENSSADEDGDTIMDVCTLNVTMYITKGELGKMLAVVPLGTVH